MESNAPRLTIPGTWTPTPPQEGMTTKKLSYRGFQAGAYGNKLRDWRSVGEWEQSGFTGLVSLRTVQASAGNGPCIYNVPPGRVLDEVSALVKSGVDPGNIVVGEMAPNDLVLLQGEYRNGPYLSGGEGVCGELLYSWVQRPMREALAAQRLTATGLAATDLLQRVMTPSSYSDWEVLLEKYPDHVLEVSTYRRSIGNTPWRNTIVWEVRRY